MKISQRSLCALFFVSNFRQFHFWFFLPIFFYDSFYLLLFNESLHSIHLLSFCLILLYKKNQNNRNNAFYIIKFANQRRIFVSLDIMEFSLMNSFSARWCENWFDILQFNLQSIVRYRTLEFSKVFIFGLQ